MKNCAQIIKEIWSESNESTELVIHMAMKRYAQQVAEDVRQRCFLNADITHNGGGVYMVDSESILHTEIILP